MIRGKSLWLFILSFNKTSHFGNASVLLVGNPSPSPRFFGTAPRRGGYAVGIDDGAL